MIYLRILSTRLKFKDLTLLFFLKQKNCTQPHTICSPLSHPPPPSWSMNAGRDLLSHVQEHRKASAQPGNQNSSRAGRSPDLFIHIEPQFLPTDVCSSFYSPSIIPFGRRDECKTGLMKFSLCWSFINRALVLPSTWPKWFSFLLNP